jgi:predicted SAM-dependent methyltransferase
VNLDKAADRPSGVEYADATALPYGDKTVEVVYSEDLFEHLTQQEQLQFLAECRRVLVSGGCCRITCPELTYSLRGSYFGLGREGVEDAWHWGHHLVPTRGYLRTLAVVVGFEPHFNNRNQSVCALMPEDCRPHPPREDWGNIFVDLVKAVT